MAKPKAPKGKKELLGYFLALHHQLEKEFNYSAEELEATSLSELKRRTKDLTDQVLCTPTGEEGVSRARRAALSTYHWLVRASQ